VVNDYSFGGLTLFLDRPVAAKLTSLPAPGVCIIHAGGPGSARLAARLPRLAKEHGLALQSFADLRAGLDRTLSRIVGSLWALIATGFVVAGFSRQHIDDERTGTNSRVRPVACRGMTRRQLLGLVLGEAGLLAFLGLLLGAPGGLVTAGSSIGAASP
jgi:hypothetical protein